jgi:hypothetical protein
LLEAHFDVVDAGCGKRKDRNWINPEKMCLYCGWTSRQVFVNHILDLSSKAGRRTCEGVIEEIRAQY